MLRVKEKPTPYPVLIERYATLMLSYGHVRHMMVLFENCGLKPVALRFAPLERRLDLELIRVRKALKLTGSEP